MSMTEDMLKLLSNEEDSNIYKNNNNDYDFGEVLKFCGGDTKTKHKIRYPDGQEKYFSFDN